MPEQLIASILSSPLFHGVLFAVAIFIIIFALSQYLRRRRRWMLQSHPINLKEAPLELSTRVEAKRLELWKTWNQNRNLDRAAWLGMIEEMATLVMRHAHPDEEQPIRKLTVDRLLNHSKDISDRLNILLNHPHLAFFRDLSLQNVQDWYKRINALSSNRIVRFVSTSWFRQTIGYIIVALQAINPFSLGSRAATTIGAELATRYFFSAFFAIIAEETWTMATGSDEEESPYSPAGALAAVASSMKTISKAELAFATKEIAASADSNRHCFAMLKQIIKEKQDEGKGKKLVSKGAPAEALPLLNEFARLPSGDEITKLGLIRALKEQAKGGRM